MSALLRRLQGGNLEVFKFSVYVFFPVALMIHFGDPDWYNRHVTPVRSQSYYIC